MGAALEAQLVAQLVAHAVAPASAQDTQAVVSTAAAQNHQFVLASDLRAASLHSLLGLVLLSDSDFTVSGRTQFIRILTTSHGDSAIRQRTKKKRSLSFVFAKSILSVVVMRTL